MCHDAKRKLYTRNIFKYRPASNLCVIIKNGLDRWETDFSFTIWNTAVLNRSWHSDWAGPNNS